jgi:hypothetical protein
MNMSSLKKKEQETQALVKNNICPDLLLSPKLANLKTTLNKMMDSSIEEPEMLNIRENDKFKNPYAEELLKL